jgi:hypothetical protein
LGENVGFGTKGKNVIYEISNFSRLMGDWREFIAALTMKYFQLRKKATTKQNKTKTKQIKK